MPAYVVDPGTDLTADEVRDLKKVFAPLDANMDGTVRVSKVKSVLEGVGEYVSTEDVEKFLKDSKLPAHGERITFPEFAKALVLFRSGGLKSKLPAHMTQPMGQQTTTTRNRGVSRTVAGASGTHSYSDEERIAFSEHINNTLIGVSDLDDLLPIDPSTEQVFSAVSNGILLSKLINVAVPETIDERALNFPTKKPLNVYQINENQNIVINAAKAIGCVVVNIHNEDLIDGREHLVLALLWQIIRIQVLSKINLVSHPELVRLLDENESMEDLMKLPPEDVLLRWLNYHLKNAGDDRVATNFGKDLKDSHIYGVVLNQIAPQELSKESVLGLADHFERATAVIANASTIGVSSFISPSNIVMGNSRLNLAFVAQIFNTRPGLDVTEEEVADMADLLDDDGDSREERVFRMWINSLGIDGLYINSLYSDLRDGVALLRTMDKVQQGIVSWKRVNRLPKNKFKKVENANYAVVLGKQMQFSLVGIGGVDVVDGKKKLILSIVWQLMRLNLMNVLRSLSFEGRTKITDREILSWANSRVLSDRKIANFRDPSLSDSLFFLDLLGAVSPGVVNSEHVTSGSTEEERVLNARYAISVARKIGCAVFCTWEDLVEVKPKMVLTFVATVMAWDKSAPGQAL